MRPVLHELHIRNLGVIEEASVAFAPGLNVVTGETGAGKTLLVTSLQLVCGSRASARVVAHGASEASVEAVVAPPPALRPRLADIGSGEEELVLARRVGADGPTRAWIDGRVVPVSALAEVGDLLVEIHGQDGSFQLARPSTQLEAIDALAANEALVTSYRAALHRLRSLERERADLAAEERVLERAAELLSYQAEEIERAGLRPDEEELLSAELHRLEHAERLAEVAAETVRLAGADGAAGQLAEAHSSLEAAAALDPALGPIVSRLGAAAAEAAECAWDLSAWSEGLDGDPAGLEHLRERKALVGALKRKYGGTVADVLRAGEEARRRLDELEGASGRLQALEADESAARVEAERLADELSSRRRRAARKLAKLVSAELPSLALPGAVFEAECLPADVWTEDGRDRVAFRFSHSEAVPAGPIGEVASGGELARAMIAVTVSLAQAHAVPVLVFDEADRGVGGEAALELGRRLARLGATHQVLVVSHLPQIAAFADRHIVVRKTSAGVDVRAAEDADRLGELSRMLAGLGSSELARAHAAELVELAARERAGPRAGRTLRRAAAR